MKETYSMIGKWYFKRWSIFLFIPINGHNIIDINFMSLYV